MKIAILSRGPTLYSTQSLLRACRRRGHQVRIIDFMRCRLSLEKGNPVLFYENQVVRNIDGIIPRIGSSVTKNGATIIRQFAAQGVPSTTDPVAMMHARDKLWSFQTLSQANISIPKTAFSFFSLDANHLIQQVGGTPLVIKLLQGTHGMGVILAENRNSAQSIMEAFFKAHQKFVVQEYIKESSGSDLRILVVGGKIVAAMKRKALPGDFRANLHRGGHGQKINLTLEEREIAIKAVALMNLEVAGVDLLQSKRGPLVLEVNASPGLEGIETVTKVDIAGKIVQLLEEKVKNKSV